MIVFRGCGHGGKDGDDFLCWERVNVAQSIGRVFLYLYEKLFSGFEGDKDWKEDMNVSETSSKPERNSRLSTVSHLAIFFTEDLHIHTSSQSHLFRCLLSSHYIRVNLPPP